MLYVGGVLYVCESACASAVLCDAFMCFSSSFLDELVGVVPLYNWSLDLGTASLSLTAANVSEIDVTALDCTKFAILDDR